MNFSNRIVAVLALLLVMSSFQVQGAAPTFAQFPSHGHAGSTPIPLRFVSKQDSEFRTELTAAATMPTNFAGNYVLTTIGCGASCVLVAAIDKKTGRVIWLPYTLCCWKLEITEPVHFQANSDLLILNGQRNERGAVGPHYVRLTRGRFIALPSHTPAMR